MNKSKEQIIKMRQSIEAELRRLPDFDFFGDSNEESKQEMAEIIGDLKLLEVNENAVIQNSDVIEWFGGGKYSSLDVYEDE
jgi:hypothetical protein